MDDFILNLIEQKVAQNNSLYQLCYDISKQLKLNEKGYYISVLFENDYNDIKGWAIVDKNDKIINKYKSLELLWNERDTFL